MQRFKIYEDKENVNPSKKEKFDQGNQGRKRPVLGEIKNVVEAKRNKSLEVNDGVQKLSLSKQSKPPIVYKSYGRSKIPVPKKRSGKPATPKVRSPIRSIRRKLSDVFKVTDYADEIYAYLRYLEIKYEIVENPLVKEKFKAGTRLALLDWFAEVHQYSQMTQETFQLSVSIMDKYLQEDESIQKKDLQLVALTSVFLASKYEEIYPIEINDLLFVCDRAYEESDIYSMELKMLSTLDFNLGQPVAACFVRRYVLVKNACRTELYLALYFTELALLSYKLCYLRPSLVAAAAFFVAMCVFREEVDEGFWDERLAEKSTYRLAEFRRLVPPLAEVIVRTSLSKYEAIKRKYSRSSCLGVSLLRGLDPDTGIINDLLP